MKTLSLIFLILAFALSVSAQCKLTTKDFPAIRGVKLGMTTADLTTMFPRATLKEPNEEGLRNFIILSRYIENVEDRKNLQGIMVELLDDEVVTFGVMYDDSVKWSSAKAFAEAVTDKFNIPINQWSFSEPFSFLYCSDFEVSVGSLGSTFALSVKLKGYKELINQKKKEIEDKKKKEFKP